MNLRPLFLSVAVLAPLAAAVWWFQRPEPPASLKDPRIGQRLADPAAIDAAERIQLTLPSGEKIVFNRSAENRWTIDGEPDLPADVTKLARLGSALVGARVERLVTSNPDRLATLGLGDTRVAFLSADGKPALELGLGKNADGGGRFLRFAEEPRAYLARLDLFLDPTAEAWRDTALLPGLAAADVASLRIQFTDTFVASSVVLSREKPDAPWTVERVPDGRQLRQSLPAAQISNLAGLRYTRVTPRVDPAVVAARVFSREVELKTFAGRTVTLTFKRLPAPPAPAEGETAPPAEPRPVYVEVADSAPDATLAAAARTHAFEIAEWIFNGRPAKPDDLFEPVPVPAPAAVAPEASTPVSVTTEPMGIDSLPPKKE